jgi:hypothetical protein
MTDFESVVDLLRSFRALVIVTGLPGKAPSLAQQVHPVHLPPRQSSYGSIHNEGLKSLHPSRPRIALDPSRAYVGMLPELG